MRQSKRARSHDLGGFRSNTSKFRAEEQSALNILTKIASSPEEIFDYSIRVDRLIPSLEQLLLPEYDNQKILSYQPSVDDKLTANQRKFLRKLRGVVGNNNPQIQAPSSEKYTHELMYFLCDQALLDSDLELGIYPSNLELIIGESIEE